MKELTIAVLIGFLPNPRMYKRIKIEKEFGRIHLVCWDRGNNTLLPPVEDGFISHVIAIKAYNNPIKRLIPYWQFSKRAMRILKKLMPDVIHVQGLDMLRIAMAYRWNYNLKARIIYEVADLHHLIIDKQKNPVKKLIRSYLRYSDRKLANQADLLIVTSQEHYDSYFSSFVDREKLCCLPNIPDLSSFENYRKKETGPFTIGYIGSIRYKEQMRNLITAAELCGVNVMIAGFEEEPIEIETLCKDKNNVKWIGRFSFADEAASLYGQCDVMYSVYNADLSNVCTAIPNKLYESVYCEIPIIGAAKTTLSKTILDWGVGLAVNHKSIEDLVEVIHQLQDDTVYKKIENHCVLVKQKLDMEHANDSFRESLRIVCDLRDRL